MRRRIQHRSRPIEARAYPSRPTAAGTAPRRPAQRVAAPIGLLPTLLAALSGSATPIGWATDDSGSWHEAANWDVALPGPGDDVTIARPNASPTITYSGSSTTLAGLVLDDGLLVNGGRLETALLTAGPGARLTAAGDGVFAVAGIPSLDGATLAATGGGLLDLAQAMHYSAGSFDRTLSASGIGANGASRIDLSGLTDLAGATGLRSALSIDALAGGQIDLSGVVRLVDATIEARADGSGSLLDLSGITTFLDTGSSLDVSTLQASRGGVLRLSTTAPISIDGFSLIREGATSVFDTARLTSLTRSTVEATGLGTTFDLGSLASFDGNSFVANGGASLALSGTGYASGANGQRLRAFGSAGTTASWIDAASLTRLEGATGLRQELRIEGVAGGIVDLSGVTELVDSSFVFQADGAGSRIDLSGVSTLVDTGSSLDVSTLSVSRGGTIALAASGPITIDGFSLRKDGATSVLDTARVVSLTNSSTEAIGIGAGFDFTALASLDGNSFAATAGAALTLPLPSYASGARDRFLRATGASGGTPSRIDGTALTRLVGGEVANSSLSITATNGGRIDLPTLPEITGTVDVVASGAGSVVDLSSLARFVDRAASSSLAASAGGRILLPASGTTRLEGVDLVASATGSIEGNRGEILAGSAVTGSGVLDLDLVVDGGRVSPGLGGAGIGDLTLGRSYEQGARGVLEIDLAGVLATSFDQVHVLGVATLQGELRIELVAPSGSSLPFDPRVGDTFDVLVAASIVDLGLVVASDFADGRRWSSSIVHTASGDTLRLSVLAAIPEPTTAVLMGMGLLGLGLGSRRTARRPCVRRPLDPPPVTRPSARAAADPDRDRAGHRVRD